MLLQVLPLGGGAARLVRLYGGSPSAVLPAALPGPDGPLALAELGPYCFAPALRAAPPAGCLWFRPAGEGAWLPADPPPDPAALHPEAGSFLEELALPASLALVGSCAFYDCRCLRRLSVGAGALRLGSDVFLNCFALQTLVLRAAPDAPTPLPVLAACLPEQLCALFQPADAAAPLAELWYPAYWEDIEETPAHILLHTFSGQGYHYRQCFAAGRVQPEEYDAIFAQGHDADDPDTVALLCFGRLRRPWRLAAGAAAAYRAHLAQNGLRVLRQLLRRQDLPGLRALLALDVLDAAALAEGGALAARADAPAAAALLAEAERRLRAAAARRRYDFDF